MSANHEQVENYENFRKDRVERLNRETFFDTASWAILVAYQSSKNASEWRRKAKSTGFSFNWRELGKWNDKDSDKWCKVMAQELANPRRDLEKKFRDRWWYIWDLAYQLTFFENENDFRQQFFHGKRQGDELTYDDVDYLLKKKKKEKILGGIGEISIPFILSNLGGDFLKDDVWIRALREWYNGLA